MLARSGSPDSKDEEPQEAVAVHQEVAEAPRAAAHGVVSEVRLGVVDEEARSVALSAAEAVAEELPEVVVAATRRISYIFEHCCGVQGIGIPGHMGTTRREKKARCT